MGLRKPVDAYWHWAMDMRWAMRSKIFRRSLWRMNEAQTQALHEWITTFGGDLDAVYITPWEARNEARTDGFAGETEAARLDAPGVPQAQGAVDNERDPGHAR